VLFADVDRDGDLDLVFGLNATQQVTISLNNGSGQFQDSGQVIATGGTVIGLAAADIDGDGDQDLVAGVISMPNLILLNNGAGVFADSGQTLGNLATNALVVGDVDGDGDTDIVECSHSDTQIRVWLNE